MPGLRRAALLMGCLLAVVVPLVLRAEPRSADILENSRVQIEGEKISLAKVHAVEQQLKVLSALQDVPCGDASPGESSDHACVRLAITTVLQEWVVERYADSHGITVGASRADGVLDSLIASHGREAFDQALLGASASAAQIRIAVERHLMFTAVRLAVARQELSRSRLLQAYEDHASSFTELRVDQIRVRSRRKALRLWEVATHGNFARLAMRYSNDTHSANRDGHIGKVLATELTSSVSRAAMRRPVGEISRPVRSGSGWHILWIRSRHLMSFKQARPALVNFLSQDIYSAWMIDQLANADIEVSSFGRFNPEAGVIDCC